MGRKPIKDNFEENNYLGFEFLPVETSHSSIEIYPPFAKLAYENFSNSSLDITFLESGSIKVSFEKMSSFEIKVFLIELKEFLRVSRRKVIDNFLIYKDTGISYL